MNGNGASHGKDEDLLLRGGNKNLLVLIHGLTGTPNEVKHLARFFHKKDYSVICPRLANHGKPLSVLKKTTWQEFYESARYEFVRCLKDTGSNNVFVGGLSMGALLALLLADEFPDKVTAVSCLSPTLFYDGWNVPWYRHFLPLAYYTPVKHFAYFKEDSPYGIKNKSIRKRVHQFFSKASLHDISGVGQFGYAYFPVTLLCQLRLLVNHLAQRFHAIKVPVQIIQAKEDDMTSMKNAQFIYDRISSSIKEIVLLENSYHIITADQERGKVSSKMSEFFNKNSCEGNLRVNRKMIRLVDQRI